ncbi:hypothetical protein L1887_07858 [Cichorium endivia]|nr:hypothetical protein L1887_07858 [Cichorium endivia]
MDDGGDAELAMRNGGVWIQKTRSVSISESDRGYLSILPIENSVGGSIHRNYDLLIRHRLHIVGEVQMIVNHCLLGLPGVRKEELNRVLSHSEYLDRTTNTTCTLQFGKPTEQEETQVKQLSRWDTTANESSLRHPLKSVLKFDFLLLSSNYRKIVRILPIIGSVMVVVPAITSHNHGVTTRITQFNHSFGTYDLALEIIGEEKW